MVMKLLVNPASASGSLQGNITLLLVLLFFWALFSKVSRYINMYPKHIGDDSFVN